MAAEPAVPAGGIAFEAHWPLRIQALAQPPDAAALAAADAANRPVLRALLALAAADGGEGSGPAGSADIVRLEARLDAALDLLADLLAVHVPLPGPVSLRLAPDRLEWSGPPPTAAENGATGCGAVAVELFPERRYPRPLRFLGITEAFGGGVRLHFSGVGETNAEALARFVFVLHRRRVALERRAGHER